METIKSKTHDDLVIRGESVQRIYENYYLKQRYLVNRRYQRKLVWTAIEKETFIDSLAKSYPVPLILLAGIPDLRFEIIDGMQRLNAIISFIEGEIDLNGYYFDLEMIPSTKLLLESGVLKQNEPKLSQEICSQIVGYNLPISTYMFNDTVDINKKIDEIFVRINSNGKHLSRQELRQAGALGDFSTLVRKLSSKIRGDDSAKDILELNKMKNISINNAKLDYGININDIFWSKNDIIRKVTLRESGDEEIVADLVAYMALENKPGSSSKILDEYYGLQESSRKDQIEEAIRKKTSDILEKQFLYVYDTLKKVIENSKKTFSELLFKEKMDKVPRYFQVIFLAFYELLIIKKKEIFIEKELIKTLENLASNHIKLSAGGGNWSAKERNQNINGIVGILEKYFKDIEKEDPALYSWTTQLENILMQSKTEQVLYDFKQGFYSLDPKNDILDKNILSKVIKTLTAISNVGKNNTGYVIIGIADNKKDAEKINRKYNTKFEEYNGFFITGIEGEARKNCKNIDEYELKIKNLIDMEPIPNEIKSYILRNMKSVNYHDKVVIIFKIESFDKPVSYEKSYYERNMSNVTEVSFENYQELFKRFS